MSNGVSPTLFFALMSQFVLVTMYFTISSPDILKQYEQKDTHVVMIMIALITIILSGTIILKAAYLYIHGQ